MRKLNAAIAMASVIALSGVTHGDEFLGTVDTDITNGANWAMGVYVGANTDPVGQDFGSLNTTADASTASPNNARALRIGEAEGQVGVLNVNSGGDLAYTSQSNWDSHIGQSGTGTVNVVAGGAVDFNFIELGRNATGVGTINVNGGDFVIARGSRENSSSISLHVGSNDNDSPGGTGTVNISGGSFVTRAGIELGNADAPDNAGTGSFNIIGSTATIDIGNVGSTVDGGWYQGAGYTLSAALDAGGISLIKIFDSATDGVPLAQFDSGSILDLSFAGTPVAGTWTLLEVDNVDIVDNGLALSATTDAGWSFAIDNSGTNGLLTVTFAGDTDVLKGDVNLDGGVTFLDINPFIGVLSTGGSQAEADCDCSGEVDFLDIQPFINLLAGQ